jgi:peptidoglycan/LPS O-acetylase OafA/YrhL
MQSSPLEPVTASVTEAKKRERVRLAALDYMRIVACLMVLVYHYSFRGGVDGGWTGLRFQEIDWLTRYGYLGVEFFFIISGFVIALTSEAATSRSFFRSRVLRLLPTYLICCTITFIICKLCSPDVFDLDFSDLLKNLLLLNFIVGTPPMDAVYWTLWVEAVFYFYVLCAISLSLSSRIELLSFLWLLASFGLILYPSHFLIKLTLADRAPWFVCGIVSFYAYRNGLTTTRALVLILSYMAACWHLSNHAEHLRKTYSEFFDDRIIYAIGGLFFICFATMRYWHRLCPENSNVVVLGLMTYPIYLLHQNIGFSIILRTAHTIGKYPSVILACTLVLLMSFIVLRYFEPKIKSIIALVFR